jgi:hypothetical protein
VYYGLNPKHVKVQHDAAAKGRAFADCNYPHSPEAPE